MRVLHLLDGTRGNEPGSGDDADACRLLLRSIPHQAHVCVVGPTGATRQIVAVSGMAALHVIRPSLGNCLLAWRDLRRFVRQTRPDVIHCWGTRMLRLVRVALPPHTPCAAVIERCAGLLPASPTRAMLNRFIRSGQGTIILTTSREACALLRLEFSAAELLIVPPPVVSQAVASSRTGTEVPTEPDPEPASIAGPERRVRRDVSGPRLLLLGHAPHADAVRFVFLAGLLRRAGKDVMPVLSVHAARCRQARVLHRMAAPDLPVVWTRARPGRMATTGDVGVWVGADPAWIGKASLQPGDAIWSIARALAIGLPVVAPAYVLHPLNLPSALVQACAAPTASLPDLARVLLNILDNPSCLPALAAAARDYAAAKNWGHQFARDVASVWHRLAGASSDRSPRADLPPTLACPVRLFR